MSTAIDRLVERQDAVLTFLRDSSQLSMALDFEDSYKKLLIMACGSLFETHLVNHICDFARVAADPRIAELVKNKALSRQYHTLFNWEAANVNQFLSVFGDVYKQRISGELAASAALTRGMRDFLQIGAERNRLAHGNLGEISPDLTVQEIKDKFYSAWSFVSYVTGTLAIDSQGMA
jgi:hypothetical protein